MSLISLAEVKGTPVFVIESSDPNYSRIYGASFDKDLKRWVFPAYPPFGNLVINDFKKIRPGTPFTPEAQAHITSLSQVPELVKNRVLPNDFQFVTKPFEHQVEALATLLQFPRFALYFDAGTGKSKIIVDLKRAYPNKRMLILTPKVTVLNWVQEFAVHSGNTIKTSPLAGTPEQKRATLRRYKEYDVLIASYGTARTIAFPRIYPDTLKAIKDSQREITASGLASLVRAIRVVSDPERQLHLALAWALGTPIAQVERFAEEEAAQTAQWLSDVDYDIIVADESHNLNNLSSQQTKVALALSKSASRRYLMSGTPTLGDPRHLFPQMKFLSPAIIPEDWLRFSDMFLVRAQWNKRIVTGFKNINILNERVQRVSARKKKEECLDLPDRTIIDVPVTLSAEQRKLYNALISEMSVDLQEYFSANSTLSVQNAAVLLNKLAQVTSGFVIDSKKKADLCDNCEHLVKCVDANIQPYTQNCHVVKKPPESLTNVLKENPKLDVLDGLLDDILANESSKVIVWGVYHAELDLIQALLEKKKINFVRMDGASGGNIQNKINKFNTDKECRVYLGQIATGIGITLNAATYTIYFTLGWSLGHYLQSIDRNYRAGQTQKVTVYRLLAEDTVDRYKAIALSEKRDLSAMLTNKIACATCERQEACLKNNIELFDEGCIYQRNVTRTVAKARLLK